MTGEAAFHELLRALSEREHFLALAHEVGVPASLLLLEDPAHGRGVGPAQHGVRALSLSLGPIEGDGRRDGVEAPEA